MRRITALGATAAVLALPAGAQAATVAQWHMDELSGTTMHDSVGTNDGTLHNVLLGQPGFLGTAYLFRGYTYKSYVSVPNSAILDPGSQNLTLSIHLKSTRLPSSKGDWDVMRKGLSSRAWKVEYFPSGQATCAFRGSLGYAELTAGPALNDGAWHAVSCTKTATQVLLTVDGTTYKLNKAVGSISNSEQLTIGARSSTAEFFKGTLDEASVDIG